MFIFLNLYNFAKIYIRSISLKYVVSDFFLTLTSSNIFPSERQVEKKGVMVNKLEYQWITP